MTTTRTRRWNLSTHSYSTRQRHRTCSESEEFVAESRATVTVKVLAGKKSRTGCSARFFSSRLRFSNLFFPVRLYSYDFRHSCFVLVEQASTCDVQPALPVLYFKNRLKLFIYLFFLFYEFQRYFHAYFRKRYTIVNFLVYKRRVLMNTFTFSVKCVWQQT